MTPIVLALVGVPAFADYYAPQATAPLDVVLTTALEVIPGEFFYRGFLLFALLRVAGPIAVEIATLPFAFAHLGKPELETLSTLGGGLLYGWLDWRTGSVLWSWFAHTWILSLAARAGVAVVRPAAERRAMPRWPYPRSMSRDVAPPEIIALAEARAEACCDRDWIRADDLLAEIDAAGWKVVDGGTMYDLERLAPPDVVEGDLVRYGASSSVPSRLDEAPTGAASVILVATDWPDDLVRALRGLAAHERTGTQIVVVANDPSEAQGSALTALASRHGAHDAAPAMDVEIVWTSTRLGWAAALNTGIRRAVAPVVILMDTSVEPVGDLVTALASALEDATVAVTGPFGPCRPTCAGSRMPRTDQVTSTPSRAMPWRSGVRTTSRAGRLTSTSRSIATSTSGGVSSCGTSRRLGGGRGRGCATTARRPGGHGVRDATCAPRVDQPPGRRARPGVEEELLPCPQAVRDAARPARDGEGGDAAGQVVHGSGRSVRWRTISCQPPITNHHRRRYQGRGLAIDHRSPGGVARRGLISCPACLQVTLSRDSRQTGRRGSSRLARILRPCVAGSVPWPPSPASPAVAARGWPDPSRGRGPGGT